LGDIRYSIPSQNFGDIDMSLSGLRPWSLSIPDNSHMLNRVAANETSLMPLCLSLESLKKLTNCFECGPSNFSQLFSKILTILSNFYQFLDPIVSIETGIMIKI